VKSAEAIARIRAGHLPLGSGRLPKLGKTRVQVGPYRIFVRFSERLHDADSTTVVLVHGLVVSSRYMVPLARRLAARFAVYAPDLPGFGWSSKPKETLTLAQLAEVLARWMDEKEIARAALVANSLGCQIAVEFATRFPDRVAGLVLQGPTMDPSARAPVPQILRWIANGWRERPSQLALLVLDYAQAGFVRFVRSFRMALEDRIEDKLDAIHAPCLVVRGGRDPIVPQAWAEEVTRRLPQGRLVVIAGAPHALNYSRPLEMARVVTPFLESLPAEASA
jgi:pimeloyl-ACP methyl ester carboxylesterase